MQDELKSVLDLFREKDKHLEIQKTPNVYITQSSTPHEVRNWLKRKQFGQRSVGVQIWVPFFQMIFYLTGITGKSYSAFVSASHTSIYISRVLEQLNAFNGLKLFKMTKKDCIAAFGKDEGTRLFSQITVSRNTADYKTARSSGERDGTENAGLSNFFLKSIIFHHSRFAYSQN
jgi:hypothetical protein